MEKISILMLFVFSSAVSAGYPNYQGCYLDKGERLLEAKFTDSQQMTIEKCIKTCADAGYQYAGLQYTTQCFCGDNPNKSGYGKKPESECSAKCSGNANQKCGGTWRMSVYRAQPYNYQGCYLDKGTRLLEAKFTHSNVMTIDLCIKTCNDAGFAMAGVQYRSQCFCGNNMYKDGYGIRPEGECAAQCTGNPNQVCGGTWRMSIYMTNRGMYQGCFVDKADRLLPGKFTTNDKMTVDKCMQTCSNAGFKYAGVQYANQCFCGNNILRNDYNKVAESECGTPCKGNSAEKCGGTWRMSVYKTDKEYYLGCYLDRPDRLLDAVDTSGSTMTTTKCRAYCQQRGYKYAGSQYSSQCFCGNVIQPGYGEKPESECSAHCAGDLSQTCGGTWRMSVYKTGIDLGDYQGCYTDKSQRLLDGKFYHDSLMTLQKCVGVCSGDGYTYAGVQYSSQCFCGNNINKPSYPKLGEDKCSAICNGNALQTCGGTWRMNVYKVKPVTGYRGCYVDKADRLFTFPMTNSNTLTLPRCREVCKQKGATFTGLQYRSQCFCGNSLKAGYSKVNDEECKLLCTGDDTKICGGTWRMSVYNTNP